MLTTLKQLKENLEKNKQKWKKKPYNKVAKSERTSIKELSEREDIIIVKADKGGVVVIVDVKNYIKEAEPQLNITEN